MKTSGFKIKRVLITAKTYPNPSFSYGETVCCAGIDIDSKSWIRLYPVPFRTLDNERKFRKYSIIEALCAKTSDDKRPESYRIQPNSIRIIDHIDTKDQWQRRKTLILKMPLTSFCRLIRDQEDKNVSLGLIKPMNISFSSEKRTLKSPQKRKIPYSQGRLFERQLEPVEEIPYHFYYSFKCASEDNCIGHKLSITDWEIGQAYRSWREKTSNEDSVLEQVQRRWLEIVDPQKKDTYFFIGNLHRFQNQFVVLGIFYPPLIKTR